MPDTIEPDPIRLFKYAVQLAGGQRASADRLDISERTVRMLLAGERTLHSGFADDMATALDAHADQCRAAAVALRTAAPHLPASRSRSDG